MSDLVRRLRAEADYGLPTCAVVREAADRIELLMSNVLAERKNQEDLWQRIENLEAYAKHERSLGAEPWMMECNDLKHRIEHLEEALREIATIAEPIRTPVGLVLPLDTSMQLIAQRALEGK